MNNDSAELRHRELPVEVQGELQPQGKLPAPLVLTGEQSIVWEAEDKDLKPGLPLSCLTVGK